MYLRHTMATGETDIRFVMSKAKVAPLQAVSVPRLELMATMVGVRLMEVVNPTWNIPVENCYYWTDSMDTLYWIRGCSRQLRPFVANRVGEIQTKSDPASWRHVGTNENPADLLSRGVTAQKLVQSELWKVGPEFLKQDSSEWPKTQCQKKEEKTQTL